MKKSHLSLYTKTLVSASIYNRSKTMMIDSDSKQETNNNGNTCIEINGRGMLFACIRSGWWL